ncbi:cupin domain-containing protein [Streptomyces sp. NBC_00820]|uniref:JmjC domain-containing protein n=1 Tax=Streptomyces sp. NBC_00820 TaxID=2975842 RepID=UPI002ED08FDF|nr:cupin domain-containing protein [Streptomyces sp. NBC_00820]
MDWLERCIPDPDHFLRTQWRQGPVLLRPDNPPTEVLTPDDLGELIDAGHLRTPYAGLFTAAGAVPEDRYCPPRIVAGRPLHGCLDPQRVRDLIRDENATLQLRYLNHWYPKVRELADGLGERLERLTEVFMFYSQPQRRGPVHRDDGDILVLQLAGAKHWQVYAGPTDASWQPVREEDPGPVLLDTVVRAGELLYVPNGYAHTAWATDEGPSLHLTVTLREAGAGHLRAQLASVLAEGLELPARPLDEADLTRTAADLLGHLGARLAATTPAELVAAARRSAFSSRPAA